MSRRNARSHSKKMYPVVGAVSGCLLGTALLLVVNSTPALAEPITVCPSNPHYFQYKNKPVLLITSDHHYGAIIDRDLTSSNS
jgi:hypothetical protein